MRSAEGRPSKEHATATTRYRGILRNPLRRPRSEAGVARVDARTKDLVNRARPGDIAFLNHEDLDRVAAEALVDAGVVAVVNAAASISGRYPNLGPLVLVEAGVTLIDQVGPLLLRKVREGDEVHVDGDRVYRGRSVIAVGIRQSEASVRRNMESARTALAERLEGFARNTLSYMQDERDMLFGGAGLPELQHDLAGQPVLVVVRGDGYREDLAALREYIRDVRPILVGVDGGADALVDEGYRPDVIVGDMDSVSDETLRLASATSLRRPSTELILHAYPDGRAPGRPRLEALGVPYATATSAGTSEDVAFLLAHERRAELIVAVGTHGNLRQFLDKGRGGMSSTFLVRLRVGEILVDAKGVSRIYGGRGFRRRDALLLVASALLAMAAVIWVSPPLRLYVDQVIDQLRQWVFEFGAGA